jgi:hypothetical protein
MSRTNLYGAPAECVPEDCFEIADLKAKLAEAMATMKLLQDYRNCANGRYHQIDGWSCRINLKCNNCDKWKIHERLKQ